MQNKFKAILATLTFSMALSVGVFASSIIETSKHHDVDVHAAVVEEFDPYTYSGNYYDSLNADSLTDGLNGSLRTSLTKLIYPSGFYTYSGDNSTDLGYVLKNVDEDPTNPNNMVLFYTHNSITKVNSSGAANWNREHCWPQNLSNNNWGTGKAGADILHIRPTYATTNSTRSNYKYGTVSSGSVKTYNGMEYGKVGGGYFEPMDFSKGDAARIIMYVWTAYKNAYSTLPEITNTFSSYEEMIEWHILDVPDELEGNRNYYSETSKQKNRNPYVDHPEWGCRVFKDKISDALYNECMAKYENGGQSSIEPTSIDIVTSNTTLSVGEERTLSVNVTPSNASKSVTWSSSNSSVISVTSDGTISALKGGSATITATSSLNMNIKDSVTFTVKEVSSISISGTPNKTTYYEGEKFNPLGLTVTALYSDGTSANVSVNDCLWYDGKTGQETLSEGTTSVVCYYGNVSATYSPITVEKATHTEATYIFNDASWNSTPSGWSGDKAMFNNDKGVQITDSFKDSPATASLSEDVTNLSEVSLVLSRNTSKGAGKVVIKVDGKEVGSMTVDTSSVSATPTEYTIPLSSVSSGKLSIEVTCTTNSIYVKSITIVSGNGSSGVEPTISGIRVTSMPNKTTYVVGETLDLTGLVVHTYDENGNNLEDVTNACSFNPAEGTILNNTGTVTISVSYQGLVTSFSVTVNEQGGGGENPNPDVPVESSTFVKVTEDKIDWTGTYLIVYESDSLAVDGSNLTSGQSSAPAVAVTISGNQIAYTEEIAKAAFEVTSAGSNKYYFKSTTNLYIGRTANKNGIDISTSKLTNTINTTINTSGFTTYVYGESGCNLEYNPSLNYFRYYTSTSGNSGDIALYELVEPTITPEAPEAEAKTFANTFLDTSLCDGGITAPSSTLWNGLANEFSLLSNEAKEIFKTGNSSDADILAAIERYDYILKKYGEDPQHGGYVNFMNRAITNNSPAVNFDLFGDASTIIVSFITVVILLASIGLIVFVIQKRRRENK